MHGTRERVHEGLHNRRQFLWNDKAFIRSQFTVKSWHPFPHRVPREFEKPNVPSISFFFLFLKETDHNFDCISAPIPASLLFFFYFFSQFSLSSLFSPFARDHGRTTTTSTLRCIVHWHTRYLCKPVYNNHKLVIIYAAYQSVTSCFESKSCRETSMWHDSCCNVLTIGYWIDEFKIVCLLYIVYLTMQVKYQYQFNGSIVFTIRLILIL